MRLLLQGDHLNAFLPPLTTLAIMYSPLLHWLPSPSCPRPNLHEVISGLNDCGWSSKFIWVLLYGDVHLNNSSPTMLFAHELRPKKSEITPEILGSEPIVHTGSFLDYFDIFFSSTTTWKLKSKISHSPFLCTLSPRPHPLWSEVVIYDCQHAVIYAIIKVN